MYEQAKQRNRTITCLNVFEIFLVVSRLDSGESIEENKKNLMLITQKVFDSIVGSAPQ